MEVTAVQQLINNLREECKAFSAENELYFNTLLELEKQQIIDAVEWNYKSNMGEVYYNAKYGKQD